MRLLRVAQDEHVVLFESASHRERRLVDRHFPGRGWSALRLSFCGRQPCRFRSCLSSMPTLQCGSGTGCEGKFWPRNSAIGVSSSRVLQPCLSYRPTAGDRRSTPSRSELPAAIGELAGAPAVGPWPRGGRDAVHDPAHRIQGAALPVQRSGSLVVGTPIANRNSAEIEDLIGFFEDLLALHTDLSGDPLHRSSGAGPRGFPWCLYAPGSPLRETGRRNAARAGPQPSSARAGGLRPAGGCGQGARPAGLRVDPFHYQHESSRFDLTLSVVASEGRLVAQWEA